MSDDFILQSLIKAFEVLKDSWSTKSEVITKCIVETEVYDGDVAMDMWLYILKKNRKELGEKDVAEKCVHNVLDKFEAQNRYKYDEWSSVFKYRVELDHIVPYMIKKPEMIKLIFGEAAILGDYYPDHLVPSLMAGIFLENKPQIASFITEVLAKNKKLIDITIGDLFRKAFELIGEVYDDSDINELYALSPEVKKAIFSSFDLVEDQKEKADCIITIMSFNPVNTNNNE